LSKRTPDRCGCCIVGTDFKGIIAGIENDHAFYGIVYAGYAINSCNDDAPIVGYDIEVSVYLVWDYCTVLQ
jgi:hypothetical protein